MSARRPDGPVNLAGFLTVGEAARLVGVSRATLRNWDKAGKLRAVRHPMNGYRLYRRTDLECILKDLRQR
jgi:excisionase family DNA binding protein